MTETARKSAEWQYLLGTLSPEDETRVEEGFISDDSYFEQLEIAEDELIDAYINDELSVEERLQFEIKLLSSQRITERVNFARTLAHHPPIQSRFETGRVTPALAVPKAKWWEGLLGRRAAFPTALAACAALIVVASGFLLFSWFQLRRESERLASERTTLQRQKEANDQLLRDQQNINELTAAELQRQQDILAEQRKQLDGGREIGNKSSPESLPGTLASLILSPGLVRDSNAPKQLSIGSAVSRVQLNLVLENNNYSSYQVTITKARDSGPVFTTAGLTARRTSSGYLLNLIVPAKKLEAGNYVVTVKGRLPNGNFEEIDDYMFRLIKS